MRRLRIGKLVFALFLPILAHVQGCKDSSSFEIINVSLKKDELFQYKTSAGGDEVSRVVFRFVIRD